MYNNIIESMDEIVNDSIFQDKTSSDEQSNNELTNDERWKFIDLYFSQQHIFVRHQIKSYDDFIFNKLKQILTENDHTIFIKRHKEGEKTTIYEEKLRFENPLITDPTQDCENNVIMTPDIARTRNLTYSSRIYVNVKQIQIIKTDNDEEERITAMEKINLTKFPVMVGSKICVLSRIKETKYTTNECKKDVGGYFIINGGEKVIIPQERMIDNKVLILKKKDQSSIISVAEIRSISSIGIIQSITIKLKKNGILTVTAPQFRDKNEIPLVVLLRAFGLESDKDIVEYISFGKVDQHLVHLLLPSLNNCYAGESPSDSNYTKIKTQETALHELVKYVRKIYRTADDPIDDKKIVYLKQILTNEFMPHMGQCLIEKAYFMCYMVNKLLNCKLERIPYDDRDNYINKRLDLAGPLLSYLFRQSLKKLIIECGKNFKKKIGNDTKFMYDPPSVIPHIKPTIEKDIKSGLLTGSWGIQNIKSRKGVAQVLKRLTYIDMLSYMRRIKSPTGDSTSAMKMIAPRLLHNTQHGCICPVETPEGQPIGLVKHLSISADVSISLENQNIIILNLIEQYITLLIKVKPSDFNTHTKIFINGRLIGISTNGQQVYTILKTNRYNSIIDRTISICYDYKYKTLRINSDGGRFFRPLFVVENNKLVITKEMISKINLDKTNDDSTYNNFDKFLLDNYNIIEYIDIEESQNILVAQNQQMLFENAINQNIYKKYTHCEIHPCLILGVVASNIPLCDHNQSPRNTYQCAQARQAMGVPVSNYRHRMMTLGYTLCYPQKPLMTTHAMKYIHSLELAAGQSVIIAITTYTGYNQEDSIIFNQSAIDRGLGRSIFYRKYDDTIHTNPTTSKKEVFCKPNSRTVSKMKPANYDKIEENGFPLEETPVTGDDIIIGKISPNLIKTTTDKPFDCSKTIRANETGTVDKVMSKIYNGDDYEICKIRVRSERTPTIGDKFSCYSDDTEVLTDSGWKLFKNVTEVDKVATLHDNSNLVYELPEEQMQYDYTGKMYSLETNQINLLVTPNHRMYISNRSGNNYGIQLAEDMYGKRVKFKKNCDSYLVDYSTIMRELNIENSQIKSFNLFNNENKIKYVIDIESWLLLYGTYLAIGKPNQLQDNKIVYSINPKNIYLINKLEEYCKNIGFEYKYNNTNKLNNIFTIYSTEMCNYLISLKNQGLPNWCWKLNTNLSRHLLINITIKKSDKFEFNKLVYFTTNNELANDFQRLCLHAGFSCNNHFRMNTNILSVITKQNKPLINKNKDKNCNNQQDKYIDYTGKVYCCRVKNDGVIYVRRNNIPVWCGNSRHGQKGTIGITLRQEDMPFTKDGLTPDMIINPHCIPSRMTVGQLLECVMSKVGAYEGHPVDGTPFQDVNIKDFERRLESYGFNKHGYEEMRCGLTGRKLDTHIFIGPTYYQRLKHMVEDKIHSRASGPQQILTRQPAEGRSRDGGFRCGEMERDCIAAHGTALFLKERLFDSSDPYELPVCAECGLFARKLRTTDNLICDNCNNSKTIYKIKIPYAFKLLVQELMSMKIAPRFVLED